MGWKDQDAVQQQRPEQQRGCCSVLHLPRGPRTSRRASFVENASSLPGSRGEGSGSGGGGSEAGRLCAAAADWGSSRLLVAGPAEGWKEGGAVREGPGKDRLESCTEQQGRHQTRAKPSAGWLGLLTNSASRHSMAGMHATHRHVATRRLA